MIFIQHPRKHISAAMIVAMSVVLVSCASPNPNAVTVTHMGTKAYGDTTTVPVRMGDTVYVMAQRLGVDMRALIDSNNLKPPYAIYPGQRLRIPRPPTVQVQKGDTLYSVARTYNADQSEMVRLNNLKPPYQLVIGQQLKLPSVPVSTAMIVKTDQSAAPVLVDEPIYEMGHVSTAPDASPRTATSEQSAEAMSQRELAASLSAAAGVGKTDNLPAPGALKAEDAQIASRSSTTSNATTTKQSAPTAPATQMANIPPKQPAASSKTQTVSGAAPRFSWPVNGSILSDFGPKAGGRHNDGLNIGAPLGSPVRAAAAGEVVYTGDKVAGFGNLILIRHSGGYATAYAHVQKPLIARGDKIAAGQAIASVGKTGNVSTPQLHFEIRKGTKPVNPKTYLP